MFLASADHAVLQYCHLIVYDCKDLICVSRSKYPDNVNKCLVLSSCRICLLLFDAKENSLKTNRDFFHFISDISMIVFRLGLPLPLMG